MGKRAFCAIALVAATALVGCAHAMYAPETCESGFVRAYDSNGFRVLVMDEDTEAVLRETSPELDGLTYATALNIVTDRARRALGTLDEKDGAWTTVVSRVPLRLSKKSTGPLGPYVINENGENVVGGDLFLVAKDCRSSGCVVSEDVAGFIERAYTSGTASKMLYPLARAYAMGVDTIKGGEEYEDSIMRPVKNAWDSFSKDGGPSEDAKRLVNGWEPYFAETTVALALPESAEDLTTWPYSREKFKLADPAGFNAVVDAWGANKTEVTADVSRCRLTYLHEAQMEYIKNNFFKVLRTHPLACLYWLTQNPQWLIPLLVAILVLLVLILRLVFRCCCGCCRSKPADAALTKPNDESNKYGATGA